MCAAEEVVLVDTVNGASLGTLATACALVIIDNGKVVNNLYCAVGTGLLALAAGNTSVLAALANSRALIVIRALDNHADSIVYKMDNVMGALACTHTATDTLGGIDLGYAIINSDSVLGADSHAVAVAEAGISTELITRVAEVGNTTALDAIVDISALGSLTVTVAGNVCNLLYYILRLDAKDGCDLLGALISAGNAEVDSIGLALCKSLGISIATRVAASAAVSAGEGVTDGEEGLILLDAKELVGNGKNYAANNRYSG